MATFVKPMQQALGLGALTLYLVDTSHKYLKNETILLNRM